jgi:NAD(P)-dependent dehydrogenase (short-subunit alcohol dehydrogenase family)
MPLPRVIANALDDALEVTVVGSFSRVGPAVRRRLQGWTDPPQDALAGRTAVITGPTSGLGRSTAETLARLGARVVLVGRDRDRLSATSAAFRDLVGADRFPIVVADLGSVVEARAAARQITEAEPRVDILIDNAGAIFPERRVGPDGLEATFALMVVSPFALVAGLLDRLRASHGRVIAVTSGGQYTQRLDLDDLGFERSPWSGPRAYARAKRAGVTLMREWNRRLGADVTFVAMHPGWADTPGLEASLPGFRRVMGPLLRTPEEGIDTTVWLAANPEATPATVGGRLLLDRRARPFDRVPATRVSARERRELWDRVVALAGIDDPAPEARAEFD